MCPDFFTPPFRSCRKTVKVIACAFKNFSQTIWQASWMKNPISVLSNMSTFRGACQTIGFPQNFYSSQKEKKFCWSYLLKLFSDRLSLLTFIHFSAKGFLMATYPHFLPEVALKVIYFLKFLASNKNFVLRICSYLLWRRRILPCPFNIAEK